MTAAPWVFLYSYTIHEWLVFIGKCTVGEYTSRMDIMRITFLSVRVVCILRFFDCLVLLS